MPYQFDAVLYDLDGTLADSCAGIEWAARCALAARWPGLNAVELRHLIGPPIRLILAAALREHGAGDIGAGDLDALEASYRELYDSRGCQMASAFPAVSEGLERRHALGLRQFVVTNKPQQPTRRMLEALGLAPFIERAVSPDSCAPRFAHKGEAALWLLQHCGLQPGRALLVGDARDDALAARFIGARFVAAAWGYGNAAQASEDAQAGGDAPVWAVAQGFGALDEMLRSGAGSST